MKLETLINEMVADGRLEIRHTTPISFGSVKECEQMFVAAFQAVDKTAKPFVMLPEYKQIIEWMANTEGKGLYLVGSNGRGKSVILMYVLPVLFRTIGKVLKPVPALELGTDKFYKDKWAVGIDDIGQETVINDYGTRIDAVEAAISYCELKLKLLFVTSNLNEKQMIARYGIRITDRLNRLCKLVVFKGESLRK